MSTNLPFPLIIRGSTVMYNEHYFIGCYVFFGKEHFFHLDYLENKTRVNHFTVYDEEQVSG